MSELGREERKIITFSEIYNTAEALREIILKEIYVLRDMDIAGLGRLQNEKEKLISKLEKQKYIIADNREILAEYSQVEREALRELSEELDKVMSENAMELIKAKEVNARVMEAISAGLSLEFGKNRGYDKRGINGHAIGKTRNVVPPLKLNESI